MRTARVRCRYSAVADQLLKSFGMAFGKFVTEVQPVIERQMATAHSSLFDGMGKHERYVELGLRLYYLSCSEHAKKELDEPARNAREGERNDPPESTTDMADLRTLLDWIGPAQWLYAAYELPCPHNTPEWAAWYAARIAACGAVGSGAAGSGAAGSGAAGSGAVGSGAAGSGAADSWHTLAVMGAASTENWCLPAFPRDRLLPAWQLAARPSSMQAVLCVRGSASPQDWAINFDSTPDEADDARSAPLMLGGRTYAAHGAMLRAARALLDECGLRAAFLQLRDAGYSLTLVGHSLGAGVAAILTALLLHEHPTARCVAYATPACVDASLAHALAPHVLSAVHNDDVVPRLSDANAAKLLAELCDDDDNYRRSSRHDFDAISRYVSSLGKTDGMSHLHLSEAKESAALEDGTASDEEAEPPLPPEPPELPEPPETTDTTETTETTEPPEISEPSDAPTTTSGGELPRTPQRDFSALIVPGRVIHLRGREGAVHAVSADGQLRTLRRIIVSAHAVNDHRMLSYVSALHAAWRSRNTEGSEGPEARAASVPARVPVPVPVVPVPPTSSRSQKVCSVCSSDVTWTRAIPDLTPSRIQATHHCRGCHQVVCAFCAPAGDQIAGGKLGEFATLPDGRMPLPSRGIFEPVRLCHPCSYRAHEL